MQFRLTPLLLFLLAGCSSNKEAATRSRPPNIVIILADDLGYGDLGTYGHPTIRTPHLDGMAAEGMKFMQFYTGASVCTPSRAALLTGRLPVRSGMADDALRVIFPPSEGGLPSSEITIAEALKKEGYATAAIGKWHLGHREEHLPTSQGFDQYFGIPYSNDMSPSTTPWGRAREFPPLPLMRDAETIEEEPDQRQITRRYTEEAVRFIEENRDGPFFLYVPHTFPHVPLFASEAFEGNSPRGLYGDVVEELDWSVGQILKTLRDYDLAEITLVVFTSDNGPWLTEQLEGGSAGLLYNGKGTTWEGGMRVPAIAWWPGVIAAGETTDALATTMDLFTTALSLAGAELPNDRVIDGMNLSPVFVDATANVRDVVHYYRGTRLWAFRKGPWKMHYVTQSAYVGDSPVERTPPALFHLDHDPSERFEVSAEYPDVLVDLQRAAEAHMATLKPGPSQLKIPTWTE